MAIWPPLICYTMINFSSVTPIHREWHFDSPEPTCSSVTAKIWLEYALYKGVCHYNLYTLQAQMRGPYAKIYGG